MPKSLAIKRKDYLFGAFLLESGMSSDIVRFRRRIRLLDGKTHEEIVSPGMIFSFFRKRPAGSATLSPYEMRVRSVAHEIGTQLLAANTEVGTIIVKRCDNRDSLGHPIRETTEEQVIPYGIYSGLILEFIGGDFRISSFLARSDRAKMWALHGLARKNPDLFRNLWVELDEEDRLRIIIFDPWRFVLNTYQGDSELLFEIFENMSREKSVGLLRELDTKRSSAICSTLEQLEGDERWQRLRRRLLSRRRPRRAPRGPRPATAPQNFGSQAT
jgi:hypothetical protein